MKKGDNVFKIPVMVDKKMDINNDPMLNKLADETQSRLAKDFKDFIMVGVKKIDDKNEALVVIPNGSVNNMAHGIMQAIDEEPALKEAMVRITERKLMEMALGRGGRDPLAGFDDMIKQAKEGRGPKGMIDALREFEATHDAGKCAECNDKDECPMAK